MKPERVFCLLTILIVAFIFYSFKNPGISSKESKSTVKSDINEIVRTNFEKSFGMADEVDSVSQITVRFLVVDSFTLKQNIDYRKKQINDSLRLPCMNSKVKNYKRTLYLLDSIAGLAEKHINDIVSYKYEYTKCTKLPIDTLYEGLAVTIKSITSNCTIYFYTDATPTRQIIQSPTNAKDNILDPLKYPDYYRRIERAGLDYEPQ